MTLNIAPLLASQLNDILFLEEEVRAFNLGRPVVAPTDETVRDFMIEKMGFGDQAILTMNAAFRGISGYLESDSAFDLRANLTRLLPQTKGEFITTSTAFMWLVESGDFFSGKDIEDSPENNLKLGLIFLHLGLGNIQGTRKLADQLFYDDGTDDAEKASFESEGWKYLEWHASNVKSVSQQREYYLFKKIKVKFDSKKKEVEAKLREKLDSVPLPHDILNRIPLSKILKDNQSAIDRAIEHETARLTFIYQRISNIILEQIPDASRTFIEDTFHRFFRDSDFENNLKVYLEKIQLDKKRYAEEERKIGIIMALLDGFEVSHGVMRRLIKVFEEDNPEVKLREHVEIFKSLYKQIKAELISKGGLHEYEAERIARNFAKRINYFPKNIQSTIDQYVQLVLKERRTTRISGLVLRVERFLSKVGVTGSSRDEYALTIADRYFDKENPMEAVRVAVMRVAAADDFLDTGRTTRDRLIDRYSNRKDAARNALAIDKMLEENSGISERSAQTLRYLRQGVYNKQFQFESDQRGASVSRRSIKFYLESSGHFREEDINYVADHLFRFSVITDYKDSRELKTKTASEMTQHFIREAAELKSVLGETNPLESVETRALMFATAGELITLHQSESHRTRATTDDHHSTRRAFTEHLQRNARPAMIARMRGVKARAFL